MPPHDPILTYLEELHTIRSSGAAVKETSYYGPLANLLNSIGAALKPRVRCVINVRNQGAGIPDGGMFTADQLQKSDGDAPLISQTPARGVIEIKGTGDDVARVAASEQVARYLARYGQVLVTNYRDFVLVGRDAQGGVQPRERFALAASEQAFWSTAPTTLAVQQGERLAEYLRRAMLANAPLADPKDVAWFLASYARDARARTEHAALPALDSVRRSLEEALGISFNGVDGEHFFRSTLIQTLFYGVFSAWVLWSRENPDPAAHFDWRAAAYYLRVPIVEALFAQVAAPNRLRPLGLIEVLDWTGAALNRVDRPAFFARFEDGAAVQYFYEPFLEAFDPELRRQLGVWYTPPEIVRYQVARVDHVLRAELGIADGLADERVRVLDPCCGTGAYLVEVLRRIAQTLREQNGDALLGDDVRRAARERVFGFELLPAPFVVAHLQLGLLLQNLGAPLDHDGERVGVFLTNALTGWEPPDAAREQVIQLQLAHMPELQHERDLARQVKRDAPILVILGNPPYDGYAAISRLDEERDLSNAYRTTVRAPKPQGQGLNNLYVRFFRMAERRIVEQTGQGVISYISPSIWLESLSSPGMRERYLDVFDKIWIDNLNGDKHKTGKLTPEGAPDPSVFSTATNPEGIQVGTAITLLVRKTAHTPANQVSFRQWWGRTKRADLLATAEQNDETLYERFTPELALGLPFMPTTTGADYLTWSLLTDLFPSFFSGVKTSRDDVVVDIDRTRLEQRMRQYFDPTISHAEMRRIAPGAMDSTARFQAEATREYLQKRGFLPENIVRYYYRPFDVRWLYWEPETKLLDEKRTEYWPQVFDGNIWIEARQKQPMERFDRGLPVRVLADNFGNGLSSYFPLYLATQPQQTLFDGAAQSGPRPNLSERALAYLAGSGEPHPSPLLPGEGTGGRTGGERVDEGVDTHPGQQLIAPLPAGRGEGGEGIGAEGGEGAALLFFHTLAVLHAPAYRVENAGALRQDWPRVPLPPGRAALAASAALGRQVAALLDSETALAGVTQGSLRPELRALGVISRVGGGSLAPDELAITARWGYAGQGGVTMPGKGKTKVQALDGGGQALDIFLNDVAYWVNVPEPVWEYTIGGYQVLKKWLSYRERPLLGRPLTTQEAREFSAIVRRIAALLLLEAELDANYEMVKG